MSPKMKRWASVPLIVLAVSGVATAALADDHDRGRREWHDRDWRRGDRDRHYDWQRYHDDWRYRGRVYYGAPAYGGPVYVDPPPVVYGPPPPPPGVNLLFSFGR